MFSKKNVLNHLAESDTLFDRDQSYLNLINRYVSNIIVLQQGIIITKIK